MRMLCGIACAALWVVSARAQVDFTGNYVQDFSGLRVQGEEALAGTEQRGEQVPVPGLPGWVVARSEEAGPEDGPMTFSANAGSARAGGLYSFGHSGSSERSLGALSSKSVSPAFGLSFVNATGKAIERVRITFTAKMWKSSTRGKDAIRFAYAVSGAGRTVSLENFLTDTGMTPHEPLDILEIPSDQENLALDGEAATCQSKVSGMLEGLDWRPGEIFFLSWTARNTKGRGAALSLDDFQLTIE